MIMEHVALVGMLVLFGLGVVVGVLDRRAQSNAWRRIARRRRELARLRTSLETFAAALDRRQSMLDRREKRSGADEE